MADRANVKSINTIADFRARLKTYIDSARTTISEAHTDVLRVQRWIDETQHHHWSMRQKKCRQLLANARSDLERAKISRPDAHPTTFVDQQRALRKAKANLEECEQKLRAIKRWSHELDREGMIFKGHLNQLDRAVEGDLNRAATWLAKLVEHLEAYASSPPPKLPEPEHPLEATPRRRRSNPAEGDVHEPPLDEVEAPEGDT